MKSILQSTFLEMANKRDSSIFNDVSDNEDINVKQNTFSTQQLLKNNNNNFSTNKNCNDNYMKHGSIRGRKTFAFWTLVCLLLFLAFGNLILTLTILGVLRLGHGMSSLELVPEAQAVKFFGNTDLGHVYKVDGKLSGYSDVPVEINGDENGSILVDLVRRGGRPLNKLNVNRKGIVVNNTSSFTVKGSNSNHHMFSTNNPYFTLLHGASKLMTKMSHTNRIMSLYNKSLELRADTTLNLKGNEGTRMETSEIVWSADQDIYLESVNGSIVFDAKNGIIMNMKSIPILNENRGSEVTQFKLCVCIPQGKLFRIPVMQGQSTRVNCNHIKMTPNYNPCI